MTKRKHPQDRAERIRIAKEKETARQRKVVAGVSKATAEPLLPDRED
jgi:hypothetical protein